MKPALRAALGGGEVSAGVCVTMGNLNELISVGRGPIFGVARLRFYVGLYAVQLGIRDGIYRLGLNSFF